MLVHNDDDDDSRRDQPDRHGITLLSVELNTSTNRSTTTSSQPSIFHGVSQSPSWRLEGWTSEVWFQSARPLIFSFLGCCRVMSSLQLNKNMWWKIQQCGSNHDD